jgi:hypothetical protein
MPQYHLQPQDYMFCFLPRIPHHAVAGLQLSYIYHTIRAILGLLAHAGRTVRVPFYTPLFGSGLWRCEIFITQHSVALHALIIDSGGCKAATSRTLAPAAVIRRR